MVNNVFSNDYNLRLRKWFFIFYFTLNTISFISFLLIRLIRKARSRIIIIKMWPNMCYSNGEFSFSVHRQLAWNIPRDYEYLHNFSSPQIMVIYYFTFSVYITSVNFLQNIFFQVHDCKSIIIKYRPGCSSNYQKMVAERYDLQKYEEI